MFFAIVFIAIGAALILNTMGLLVGNFWGVFWGILFLAIGLKMLKRNNCPMCGFGMWKGKIFGKIHDRVHEQCCDEECCDEECCEKPEKIEKQKKK